MPERNRSQSRTQHHALACALALGHMALPAAASVPTENFEAYAVGALAGQGEWYSPNNTGEGWVVAGGIAGQSARVHCVATPGFSWSIGRVFAPDYGVLSISVQAPPTSTYFLLGPNSDPIAATGLLDPHGSVIVDGTRELWIYQRFGGGGGYVPLGGGIAENEIVRLSWDVRADGSVRLYRNGRLHFVGQSEVIALEGSMHPIGSFVLGCGNNVPRSDDASRDVLTIDDLGASLPTSADPVGQVDLALVASLAHQPLGAAIVAGADVGPGASQPIQFIAINSGVSAASGVQFSGTLPDGFSLGASDCGIVQVGTTWSSATRTLAAGANTICHAQLLRGPPFGAGLVEIITTLASSSTDPYVTNNTKRVFVQQGEGDALFADGFE